MWLALEDEADILTTEQSYKFGFDFAALTLVTMSAYAWFTIKTTAWRCVLFLPGRSYRT